MKTKKKHVGEMQEEIGGETGTQAGVVARSSVTVVQLVEERG